MDSVFSTLNGVNVNKYTEERDGLTYLSWSFAWEEVKKRYPNATYSIYRNEDGLPYAYDPNTGYMVYASVTIEGLTHDMWLPVMDSKNKAMKAEPYEYQTKYGKKRVEAATMFDVNKAIMRCLCKAIAAHGLGLYIYSGLDLPNSDSDKQESVHTDDEKNALLYSLDFSIQSLADLRAIEKEEAITLIMQRFNLQGGLEDQDYDTLRKIDAKVSDWIVKVSQ